MELKRCRKIVVLVCRYMCISFNLFSASRQCFCRLPRFNTKSLNCPKNTDSKCCQQEVSILMSPCNCNLLQLGGVPIFWALNGFKAKHSESNRCMLNMLCFACKGQMCHCVYTTLGQHQTRLSQDNRLGPLHTSKICGLTEI